MQFKAVCFDLDGTLLDSLKDLAICINEILLNRGLPTHSLDKYRYFVGDGLRNLITRSLPQDARNKSFIQECQKDFEQIYREGWHKNSRLYENIPELLNELSNLKIRLTILSNKPHEFTLLAVDRFLSNWKFDFILGQRKDILKKPNPEGFFKIKNKLQLPSKTFVFLGDTGTDMKTASAAGCHSVGVLWGFRSENELKKNGACDIINKPLELLDIINQ